MGFLEEGCRRGNETDLVPPPPHPRGTHEYYKGQYYTDNDEGKIRAGFLGEALVGRNAPGRGKVPG